MKDTSLKPKHKTNKMKRVVFILFLMMFAFLSIFFIGGCRVKKIYQKENVHLLEATEFMTRIESTNEPYIIDVRTPFEFYRGHIDSAINISYIGFDFKKRARRLDTAKSVFIYCHTAHRSPYAAKKLYKMGFKEIIDLKDGYRSLSKKNKQNKQ